MLFSMAQPKIKLTLCNLPVQHLKLMSQDIEFSKQTMKQLGRLQKD